MYEVGRPPLVASTLINIKTMNRLIIQGCTLVRTCGACPEQYDVYFGDFQIGYLRLRHGSFSASYPDYTGETVFHAHPKGDGMFEDDERMGYLTQAVCSLLNHHNNKILEKWDYVD